MKKLLLAALLPLVLCANNGSCAHIATPERCEDAARAARTIEQLAAVLVNQGIEAERAAKLARAAAAGQIAIDMACAAANQPG